MKIAGFTKSQIPFEMFDVARAAAEAKRAAKLSNIYHRGQQKAWDGRQVLAELIEKHGGVSVPDDQRRAILRIFGIILWGELAAWKISAQLADRLVPLEAKMAATSQVHDEARHFYVMYDYLSELGEVPTKVDRPTRAVLDLVLNTDSLLEKVIGMQLMVETLALTIFQLVREANVEPVLSELLVYYERDEARHVGLGIQHLPEMMKQSSLRKNLKAVAFQLKIAAWVLRGLKLLEGDLASLGIDSRRVIQVGRNKMFTATEMLWEGMGTRRPLARDKVDAGLDSVMELMFPSPGTGRSYFARLRAARRTWKKGGITVQRVELAGG